MNWDKLDNVTVGKPYFLSGGIEPSDAENLMTFAAKPEAKALFSIDINSKFELAPGIKDIGAIQKFIKELH